MSSVLRQYVISKLNTHKGHGNTRAIGDILANQVTPNGGWEIPGKDSARERSDAFLPQFNSISASHR